MRRDVFMNFVFVVPRVVLRVVLRMVPRLVLRVVLRMVPRLVLRMVPRLVLRVVLRGCVVCVKVVPFTLTSSSTSEQYVSGNGKSVRSFQSNIQFHN